jgi:hypothetical protein
MALPDAVQGATRPQYQLTWVDADGDAVDLTGATVTVRIRDRSTYTTTATGGTVTLTTAASGIFTWTPGAADVATAGVYDVQFSAAYSTPPSPERTVLESWTVHEAI